MSSREGQATHFNASTFSLIAFRKIFLSAEHIPYSNNHLTEIKICTTQQRAGTL